MLDESPFQHLLPVVGGDGDDRLLAEPQGVEMVDIQSSGKLQGDVKAPRVSIADGAYFKGRVEMTGAAEPAKPKSAPAQRSVPSAEPA